MPIDYSKWDNIDVSDSDDDDSKNSGGGDGSRGIANVTRFDAPSSVTFGGGGGGDGKHQQEQTITVTTPSLNSQITSCSKTDNHVPSSSAPPLPSVEPNQAVAPSVPAPATQQATSNKEETAWTDTGGSCSIPVAVDDVDDSTTSSSSSRRQLQRNVYWSQDRYSVTITIELLDDETKILSVFVNGIVSYRDRFSATQTDTSSKPRLRIVATTAANASAVAAARTAASSRIIVDDELPYPVHLAEEDEDSDSDNMKTDRDGEGRSIDWTIVRKSEPPSGQGQGQHAAISKRYLQVTLYKAVPMYGIFLWWRRPFMQCPEVNIQHNNKCNGSGVSGDSSVNAEGSATSSNEKFLEAWNQAHKIFKENIKDGKNQSPS